MLHLKVDFPFKAIVYHSTAWTCHQIIFRIFLTALIITKCPLTNILSKRIPLRNIKFHIDIVWIICIKLHLFEFSSVVFDLFTVYFPITVCRHHTFPIIDILYYSISVHSKNTNLVSFGKLGSISFLYSTCTRSCIKISTIRYTDL